ncbi:MAG: GTP pyrophosphokinase family protein [Firmicutes bacterium]|nr:GTP pyrophosphokinase family protein [Bacillota bacterium]
MDYLQKQVLKSSIIPAIPPEKILGTADQLQEALMMYSCAIREVKTKLEVLNDELSIRNQRNPIEFIKTRVKKPYSILEKLNRRGFEISIQSVFENLNDVAGIRVICSFVDDIYTVAEMLTNQDDVTLLEVKDYIKNPKPNGYRSLHLIIQVPVYFSDKKEELRAEVQIRTIAMDFWASLEHDLRYKQDIPDTEAVQEELKSCADTIANTDKRMMALRDKIETMKSANVEKKEEKKTNVFK